MGFKCNTPNMLGLSKPTHEGQTIKGLYCGCGFCKTRHAWVKAVMRPVMGYKALYWEYHEPCISRITKRAFKVASKAKEAK